MLAAARSPPSAWHELHPCSYAGQQNHHWNHSQRERTNSPPEAHDRNSSLSPLIVIPVGLCHYLHAQATGTIGTSRRQLKIMQRHNTRQTGHTTDNGCKIVITATYLYLNG